MKLVILDRDGVINYDSAVHQVAGGMEADSGSLEAIARPQPGRLSRRRRDQPVRRRASLV